MPSLFQRVSRLACYERAVLSDAAWISCQCALINVAKVVTTVDGSVDLTRDRVGSFLLTMLMITKEGYNFTAESNKDCIHLLI